MPGWLGHIMGLDSGNSPFYLFWSGIWDLSMGGVLVAHLRHRNCEVRHCLRMGRHVTDGNHRVCGRHHPDGAPTAQDVIDKHERAS